MDKEYIIEQINKILEDIKDDKIMDAIEKLFQLKMDLIS